MPALPRVDRIKTIYSAAKGLNYAWRFTDFLKTPAGNGISRYTPQVHRITFRFCKQAEDSAGMRNFIEHRLVQIGKQNPSVVLYAQPVRNNKPSIRAEYGNGGIIDVQTTNSTMGDIERDVIRLLSRSGQGIVKLETRQNAVVPSIQGQWNPTTWLQSSMNVTPLPDEQFSKTKSTKESATDYFLSKAKH